MTFEAFHTLPPPITPFTELPSPLRDLFVQPASEGLSPGLLQADPGEVGFDLDAQSVRIIGEHEDQWNTSYTASGEMQLSAPGTGTTTVPVRFDVTLRNENATPAQMRAVNPFDPATIPERTRIEVYGRDYAGTP
ncbi:MAG: hypothetical protein ACM32J_06285, partial [Rhizobacter sp.]